MPAQASPSEAPSQRRYLTICGLQELETFQNASVTHVLSILDPGHPEPADFAAYGPHKRLTLRFDDIINSAPGMMLPERHHIEALLEFGKGLAAATDDPLNHLLVHCHADETNAQLPRSGLDAGVGQRFG